MTVIIFLGSLLGGMALGMPIAFALLVCGAALMYHLDMMDAQIVAQNVINGVDSFPLLAVPFFILAGELMNAGGLSKRIVDVAVAMLGHRKGGLGYVAILAATILAALSGSAIADAAALSAFLLPMMVKAGHNRGRAGGLIAAAGIIAPIIPPRIPFVVFGVIGGVSITKLFLAGIVPGLLLAVGLCVAWAIVAHKEPVETLPKMPFAQALPLIFSSLWALGLPAIIIFGMKFGIFTPTEAAVVAVIYALLVGMFAYRELKLPDIYRLLVQAATTTSVVMLVVAAALVSAWLITISNITGSVVELMRPFMDNKTLLMFAIMVLLNYSLFATENSTVLYLEFSRTYMSTDVRGEGRTDAALLLKGDGSYTPTTETFSDLRNFGEHLKYRMPDGTERKIRNAVLFAAGMVLGHKEITSVVRYKLNDKH